MNITEKFNLLLVQFMIPKDEYEKAGFYNNNENSDILEQTEFENMYDDYYNNLENYKTERFYNGRNSTGNILNIKYKMTYYWHRRNMFEFDILAPFDIILSNNTITTVDLCIKLKMKQGYIDKYDKHNIGVDDNNYNIVSFNKLKYSKKHWNKLLDIFERFNTKPMFINSHEYIENNNIELVGNNIISNNNVNKIFIKLRLIDPNICNNFVIKKGKPICTIYNGGLTKFHVLRVPNINSIFNL